MSAGPQPLPSCIPLTVEEAGDRLTAILGVLDDFTSRQTAARAEQLELSLALDTLAEIRAIATRMTGWRPPDTAVRDRTL